MFIFLKRKENSENSTNTKKKQNKNNNFLLIQGRYDDKDTGESRTQYHYVWVKSRSCLLSRQLNQHTSKKYLCHRCLHHFYTNERLNKHIEHWKKPNERAIKMRVEIF